MISKNNLIQISCLFFLLVLNLAFLFFGISEISGYFNSITDVSYTSFNWPLVFSWFIELIITCSLIGITSLSISKIKVNKFEYNSLLVTYFFIYVVIKLIENLIYFINLSSLVENGFFSVLTTGSIINFVFSIVIFLTLLILLIKKNNELKIYIVGSEVFLLVLLNLIFPVFYSQFQTGQFIMEIVFILFIVFSLVMNYIVQFKNKGNKFKKGEEAYEK